MSSDESSFYLYGVGASPDALTLGSLVLEKYWEPLIARHYSHALLKDQDLEDNVWSSTLKNCIFYGRTRLTPDVGVSGFEIIDLRLAWQKDHERIVMAKSGRRMTLKDPEKFLHTHVLTNPQAQSSLKLWLSSARSQYVMNMKWARRPKIWLLTGLYILEGTRTVVRKSTSTKVEAGVNSALIGAVSSVPIGGSISLGMGDEWEMAMEMDEGHVWAAQYRLVDARYLLGRSGQKAGGLPVIGLYKDILSVNMKRGGTADEVEVALSPASEAVDEEKDEKDEEAYEEYEKKLEEAIRIFEDAPRMLLN
ncbi:hypothetical protein BGW36DRAFT_379524 [Talaromyces proteolyticus]|uniref:Uncharacterized protein n=1 Tax=Talaromyces proteolyticus TaxID=1131652 RepID=A0AAD4PYK1_9EURO|nr:uncharacterized protein BGW36DRAFT_379524 [Talaromyces proteolyticus]KAH8697814.1 hypothetical protein BGW36DRAFT_379524 [Talaromyces proteolyticus]